MREKYVIVVCGSCSDYREFNQRIVGVFQSLELAKKHYQLTKEEGMIVQLTTPKEDLDEKMI